MKRMKRTFVRGKRRSWLVGGLWLAAVLLLAGCVPTAEPVAIIETRTPAATVVTATAVTGAAAGETTAPAILAQWDEVERRYELRPVDALTGGDIPGYTPLPVGGTSQYTLQTELSTDGRLLAVIEGNGSACEPSGGGSACRARADNLHLVNVAAWQSRTAVLAGEGWVGPLVFSADGSRLALAYHTQAGTRILLYDTATGAQLGQQSIAFRPALMAFTGERSLLLAGADDVDAGEARGVAPPGPFTVQVLSDVTLSTLWSQTLPEILSGSWCTAACAGPHGQRRTESWQPGVVAAPDGRFLYIAHADEAKLTTVDVDGRAVQTVPIQAPQSWLERLLSLTANTAAAKSLMDGAAKSAALSPDGSRLYLAGTAWHAEDDDAGQAQQADHLGLQVVDVATGHLLAARETTAEQLRLTPDGQYLLLDGWQENGRWFEVWDAASLERITRLEDREVTAVPLLDGGYALLAGTSSGQQLYLSLMAPPRFKCAPVWTADSPIVWIGE